MGATKNYLVRFRPLEPYFFGNEHRFELDGNSEYYIKSEKLPTQTTLLGTLRFALMKHYHTDRAAYTPGQLAENDALIGKNSFCMHGEDAACASSSFGAIKGMSHLFLVDSLGRKYIPVPFDHAVRRKEGDDWLENNVYTPMRCYQAAQVGATDSSGYQKKLLPVDYRDKDGLTDSFVGIGPDNDGSVLDGIFTSTEKTGIQKLGSDEAFFKRSCCVLDRHYSFGIIVELDESVRPENQTVFMGQQKSAFSLTFEETVLSPKEYEGEIWEWLKRFHSGIDALRNYRIWYAVGDCFAGSDIYDKCLCALTKIRDFRCLTVKNRGSNSYHDIKRSQHLYRLIRAGSFFVTEKDVDLAMSLNDNDNCCVVGMNQLITERE